MKEKTCFFTGHRKIAPERLEETEKRLTREILRLIGQGVVYFGTGGAPGFDTIAAKAVLHLREEHKQIKLILVLPCKDQAKDWQEQDTSTYQWIMQQADTVVYTSRQYGKDCMHQRNRYMAEHSGHCICYLLEDWSSTAYTVAYAKQLGVCIVNLALT